MSPRDDNAGTDPFDVKAIENIEAREDAGGASAISRLSEELESIKRRLNDERFVFVLFSMILFDAWSFHSAQSWGGPVSVLILEVVALAVLARVLGVSELTRLLEQLISSFGRQS